MPKTLTFRNNKTYVIISTIYNQEKNNTVFYKALDVNLDRIVGIKIIGYNNDTKKSLINECRALIKVEAVADNVPSLYDYYDDFREKKLVMVMQYIEGVTLNEIIKDNEGKYEDYSVINGNIKLLIQISRTLGQIHKVPYLQHKDLKPQNIIVKNYGSTSQSVYIIDFGISAKATTRGIGTPGYEAPEQMYGKLGTNYDRIDIFAMGLIAFEMLTGKRIRIGTDLRQTSKDVEWKTVPEFKAYNKNMSDEIIKVLKKCLCRQPKNRYRNGEELERALFYALKSRRRNK
ncbi:MULTISPECIES: serine/threonine-protein kinase [Clostridium]|uniref:serine/threonine-protein kinase n=1 Tax=Clostridium TaxID=1485 RepID=UPI00082542B7|nr:MULTISPECIES: serine/threonine-protein kinase [Clostridium]PJI06847.1 serine/threonine protein kinase [Clostridium sp. CT7]